MSNQKIEDKAYIQGKLDEILKPMLTKMFVINPSDPVSVSKKGGEVAYPVLLIRSLGRIHASLSPRQPRQETGVQC